MKKVLIITAHPDDEALWFSSIALRNNADLICITCGNNKKIRARRLEELETSCHLLGIGNLEVLNFNDDFESRLDIDKLAKILDKFKSENYDEVYTHGPLGDTNEHIHHQDISYVVNQVFDNVYCTAWNLYPTIINNLSEGEYRIKKFIMGTIYHVEYYRLIETYEISSVEKFIKISRDASKVYYWGIANFGDNHDFLSKSYKDIWGYQHSPYEIERHNRIVEIVKKLKPDRTLEIGSSEGILTDKISSLTKVDCTENVPLYIETLTAKGYKVTRSPKYSAYDLTIVAGVLEYITNKKVFLKNLSSKYLLIDIIISSKLSELVETTLAESHVLIEKTIQLPIWEKMYVNGKKEDLELYRLGSTIYLYEKRN